MKLSGWGRYPIHECNVNYPRSEEELKTFVKQGFSIANGNGRSYGDSALSISNTISMKYFNHMLDFNNDTGELVLESGVLLADVISTFLPLGWFPSVTPGTKFVTIGGMIAADVHGKNHHKHGSFGNFVNWIELIDSDGNVIKCSKLENSEQFDWTIGGMGLTGIVIRVAFSLLKVDTGWVRQTTIPSKNLKSTIDIIEKSMNATYSVAWIDCMHKNHQLGRSIVMLGEHAKIKDLSEDIIKKPYNIIKKRKMLIPFNLPRLIFNRFSMRIFNTFYYKKESLKKGTKVVSWDSFFYPLDSILKWNRIYGRKGFAQFQCVLPLKNSLEGIEAMLKVISESGCGSFLVVLKRFGKQESKFSFPMEGYTLSLDFQVSIKALKLMNNLDKITIEYGGRFYLAKDSRMSLQTLSASDERAKEFSQFRASLNCTEKFSSIQSERLGL